MDPASRADNVRRVPEELQCTAPDELRSAKQLTQSAMAELPNVPQSSISRIEQGTNMYPRTVRNYIHAVGGELRSQAVFPSGGPDAGIRESPGTGSAMIEIGGSGNGGRGELGLDNPKGSSV